ncbi:MAG: hypothetical protein AB7K52_00445 [Phycisphaerales bacterium]
MPALAQLARRCGLGAALLGVLALGACQRSFIPATIETNYPADDVAKELEFWHTLPARSAVCNDEGLHGLILLADNQDTTGSYTARLALAKQRGWVSHDFNEPGNLAMQRGTLARAVCVICKIQGGLMMTVFGPIPRYATRELVYMRLMGDPSTENLAITGLEYMGVISKAQDYMMLQAVPPAPAAPSTPDAPPPAAPAAPAEPAEAPANPPQ